MTDAPSQLLTVPYHEDPLKALAARIIADHGGQLPLLDGVVVLLPNRQAAPALRRELLAQAEALGHGALLGPQIHSLGDWINDRPFDGPAIVNDYTRELLLVEALRAHKGLFGGASEWALADTLLELFDQLTLNRIGLPEDLEAFTRQLKAAYGEHPEEFAALGMEARLVHTLWHAYHEQLQALGYIDRNAAYLLRLAAVSETTENHLYLAGFHGFSRAELIWLHQMLEAGRLTLLLHGKPNPGSPEHSPDTPLTDLLKELGLPPSPTTATNGTALSALIEQALYASAPPLAERARRHGGEQGPCRERLRILAGEGAEEEARAVELQVRRWLLAGHRRVAIVTENRRLARRVSALLARAGIELQDAAGWALATTSAATVIERWLQCIEEDFPHQALLDLLKSPFFPGGKEREQHLATVYRLEQDIIQHENINRGMERYLRHIPYRIERLPEALHGGLQRVERLLQRLQRSAEPLTTLLASPGRRHHPEQLLAALADSLYRLGIEPPLTADAAGSRLLEEIGRMRHAVLAEMQPMSWPEFRAWLGRSWERFSFQPARTQGVVQLMNLGQSVLGQFDGLIIAGAERDHLPGAEAHSPFFNDAVRGALGLPFSEQRACERHYHFRRLLESGREVLITLRREQDGEPILPSPWVEALQSLHRLAFDDDLHDDELLALVRDPRTLVVDPSPAAPVPERPLPSLPAERLPAAFSAAAYQQLLDCPYQFFAARGLGLQPPEEIREGLEKADYGERVHLCLEAFHGGVEGLPGPFDQPLTPSSRARAEALLVDISEAVFARDLADNFLHRGWLRRWRERIPDYLAWQEAREAEGWRVTLTEQNSEVAAGGNNPALRGRLDRIDRGEGGLAIVDYKTGRVPTDEDVLAGEKIQLPFYLLLAEGSEPGTAVAAVEYLSLDGRKVESKGRLDGDELHRLSQEVGERLAALNEQITDGTPMPAWGDSTSCQWCQLGSVCRRQVWGEKPAQPAS